MNSFFLHHWLEATSLGWVKFQFGDGKEKKMEKSKFYHFPTKADLIRWHTDL